MIWRKVKAWPGPGHHYVSLQLAPGSSWCPRFTVYRVDKGGSKVPWWTVRENTIPSKESVWSHSNEWYAFRHVRLVALGERHDKGLTGW